MARKRVVILILKLLAAIVGGSALVMVLVAIGSRFSTRLRAMLWDD